MCIIILKILYYQVIYSLGEIGNQLYSQEPSTAKTLVSRQ